MNHLCQILDKETKNKIIKSIYLFNGEYNDFYSKYKFLCNNNNKIKKIKKIEYPNMILEDELFLGDGFMSEEKNVMINLKITHIINVTKCFFMLDEKIKKKIAYLQLQIDDSAAETISKFFDKACDFIDQALKQNNNKKKKNVVFVHCMAGISRSASIMIAYLMKMKKYTLCEAYIHVKKCRPRISPNSGFLKELVEYEKKIFIKSTKDELDKALKEKKYL